MKGRDSVQTRRRLCDTFDAGCSCNTAGVGGLHHLSAVPINDVSLAPHTSTPKRPATSA